MGDDHGLGTVCKDVCSEQTRKLRKAYFGISIAPFERLRNTFSGFYHDCFDHYRLILLQIVAQPTSNAGSKAEFSRAKTILSAVLTS